MQSKYLYLNRQNPAPRRSHLNSIWEIVEWHRWFPDDTDWMKWYNAARRRAHLAWPPLKYASACNQHTIAPNPKQNANETKWNRLFVVFEQNPNANGTHLNIIFIGQRKHWHDSRQRYPDLANVQVTQKLWKNFNAAWLFFQFDDTFTAFIPFRIHEHHLEHLTWSTQNHTMSRVPIFANHQTDVRHQLLGIQVGNFMQYARGIVHLKKWKMQRENRSVWSLVLMLQSFSRKLRLTSIISGGFCCSSSILVFALQSTRWCTGSMNEQTKTKTKMFGWYQNQPL